ncbi:competence protein CoiA [Vogesella sp. LIG4]|uniref:competence protein CoiA n=1 Tax=Vogesella sp. LIG4 TaxID=1192162 RepID=UPI000820104E|nr:competence protein CoiA family protein [Vogesella sp. LIG4]SCK14437.1 competence protein CoiA [Vogesella sp. LIG4]
MPLRCIDDLGNSIQSFSLDDQQWAALQRENALRRHLRMACCDTPAVLKTSKLGMRFFAHAKRGECTSAPESEHHLTLKAIAASAIQACGWNVATEVPGETPAGEKWIADVLATRGNARVAVEIQWSGQTADETMRRQERYHQSGVRALWLLRQPGFPVTEKLPAACVHLDDETGVYRAMLPRHESMNSSDRKYPRLWHQVMPVGEFIHAAFRRRFTFGKIQQGESVTIQVMGVWVKCWDCEEWTRLITDINFLREDKIYTFSIDDIGPNLANLIGLDRLRHKKVGAIKSRYSKTEKEIYLSNGCIKCDALQDRYSVWKRKHKAEIIFEVDMLVDARMKALINGYYFPHWNVSDDGQRR